LKDVNEEKETQTLSNKSLKSVRVEEHSTKLGTSGKNESNFLMQCLNVFKKNSRNKLTIKQTNTKG